MRVYAIISSAFANSLGDFGDGGDVAEAVDGASDVFRDVVVRNYGYGY